MLYIYTRINGKNVAFCYTYTFGDRPSAAGLPNRFTRPYSPTFELSAKTYVKAAMPVPSTPHQ
jgi:hypothetical protein